MEKELEFLMLLPTEAIEGRVMASHSSGALDNGWSYAFLASRRFGGEGYINGTLYDSNSFFATVEKQLGANHSLNVRDLYPKQKGTFYSPHQ